MSINSNHEVLIANAMKSMGWDYDLAKETLNRVLEMREGEQLIIHLQALGYITV